MSITKNLSLLAPKVATDGTLSYSDLTNKPTISTVGTSGSYNDLLNKPVIPSITGLATETFVTTQITNLINGAPAALDTLKEITDKLATDESTVSALITTVAGKANTSSLSTVATTGSYTDLLNKPTLFSGSYTDLTNKPTLFSGSYTDLTNKPGYTVGTTAPINPLSGDRWVSSNTGIEYTYVTDGDSSQWVELGTVQISGTAATITPYSVGDILFSSSQPTNGTWLKTGKLYSKALYPALATKLGNIADLGNYSISPQANFPVAFTSTPTAGALYVTATDGTVTVLGGAYGALRKTTDGINWVPVASKLGTNNINEVKYLNGNFVAINGAGSITTSPDGTNWTLRPSAIVSSLNSITYGAGVYVAVGANGIYYSSDLDNWNIIPTTYSLVFNRVIYAGGYFVAVGNNGVTYTSTNGTSWINKTTASTTILDIAYNGTIYVAVTNGGTVRTSTDLTTWTQSAGVSGTLNQVIYANGLFIVASSAGLILTSSNGTTWTTWNAPSYIFPINSVCWNGTNYVAVSNYGRYFVSSNGTTWTEYFDESSSTFNVATVVSGKTILLSSNTASVIVAGASRTEIFRTGTFGRYSTAVNTALSPKMIAYNGTNKYVLVGSGAAGAVWTSSDAINWTGQITGTSTPLNIVHYVNNKFIALGSNYGTVMVSTDGTTWTNSGINISNSQAAFNACAYGNSTYVVVGSASGGSTSAIYSSSDAITWTARTTGAASYFTDVTFGNGIFVAVGASGQCYSSTDGTTWTSRSAGSTILHRIYYANSKFIAVGGAGVIYSSTDGITWTLQTSNVTAALLDVTWNGTIWCAVGANSNITTSTDGTTWTSRSTISTELQLVSVTWNGTRFVAVGTNACGLLISSDGITWSRSSPAYQYSLGYNYCTYQGGKTILVGVGPGVVVSDDGFTWTNTSLTRVPFSSFIAKIYKFGSYYYAVTSGGVWKSSDGINFSQPSSTCPGGGNSYVELGYNGTDIVLVSSSVGNYYTPLSIYKSTDNGNTWVKTAEIGTRPIGTAGNITVTGVKYSAGNFVLGLSSINPIQDARYSVYTSPNGVTWTGRAIPYLNAVYGMATDGTVIAATTPNMTIKSADGGITWGMATNMGGSISYVQGVWIIGTAYRTTDFIEYYTGGLYGSIYASGNNMVSTIGSTKFYTTKYGAAGTTSVGVLPAANANAAAIPAITVNDGYSESVVNNTNILVATNANNGQYPFAIAEIPLYSYDTSTTFFVPPTASDPGSTAYVYAGA